MAELLTTLASIFGSKIAEKLAKELLRGKQLDQITIDQFMTKSKKRRVGLLVAVERGEMLLRSKENA